MVVIFSVSCQDSASNIQDKPPKVVMDLVAEPIIIGEPLSNDSSFQIETEIRVLAYRGQQLFYLYHIFVFCIILSIPTFYFYHRQILVSQDLSNNKG